MLSELFAAIVAGIALGIPLFIVASGLTLIFGVLGILNFAHGAFFMFGAYFLVSLLGGAPSPILVAAACAALAALAVAIMGAFSEITVFRLLYRRDHTTTLLASYAMLLVLEGLAERIWGTTPKVQARPEEISGSISFLGTRVATYDLVLIAIGVIIAVGLYLLLQRTRVGQTIRAVAHDETMARALGVNARAIQIGVFTLGAGLAGLAGALVTPINPTSLEMAPGFIVQAFAIVIIGGLSSVWGALIAALVIGLADSLSVSFLPGMNGFGLYIAVALVLLLRPQGIFGTTARYH